MPNWISSFDRTCQVHIPLSVAITKRIGFHNFKEELLSRITSVQTILLQEFGILTLTFAGLNRVQLYHTFQHSAHMQNFNDLKQHQFHQSTGKLHSCFVFLQSVMNYLFNLNKIWIWTTVSGF